MCQEVLEYPRLKCMEPQEARIRTTLFLGIHIRLFTIWAWGLLEPNKGFCGDLYEAALQRKKNKVIPPFIAITAEEGGTTSPRLRFKSY